MAMRRITLNVPETVYQDIQKLADYQGIAINRQAYKLLRSGLAAAEPPNADAITDHLRAVIGQLIEREEQCGITLRKLVSRIRGATYLDVRPILAAMVASGEVEAVQGKRTTLYYPGQGVYLPM